MKHKRIGTILAALQLFFLVGTIAGYFYLKSDSFKKLALRKIVEQADKATGGKTQIGGLDFNLSTLTAHLYNITLRGTEAPDQSPLLHADKLTLGVHILSIMRHQFSLRELLIDHPVVHMQVSREGKNNLPPAPPSQGGSGTSSIFDLAAEHVQVTNGEVDYNDRKIPLDASFYNLGMEIRFNALARQYEGSLSYRNGNVLYARYAPLAHNLNLIFTVSPEKITLKSATLTVGSSNLTLQAQLSDYANPVADGDYQVRIHAQDFAPLAPGVSPAGDIVLNGTLHYQQAGAQPLIKNVSINGQLASGAISAVASGNRVEIRKLRGTYQLAGGNLNLSDLTMDSFGGAISGSVEMAHLDTTPEGRAQAALHGISLAAMQRALGVRNIQGMALAGSISGKADAAWKGDISNVRATSDLVLRASASSQGKSSSREIPLDGTIHAIYGGAKETLELRQTTLKTPALVLTANGQVSDRSALHVQVSANDLHQVGELVASFLPAQSTIPALSGSANLNVDVQGSLKKPAIAARLNAQNLHVEGSEWSSAKFDVRADPSQISVQNGSLVSATSGRAAFSASVRLKNWSYQPSDPMKAHLDVQHMKVADLQRLAKQNYPLSGDLSANLSLDGSQLKPEGSGSITLTSARIYGEPVQNLTLTSRAANGSIDATLKATAAAGAVNGTLSFTPKTRAYKVKLDAPAVVLQKLQTVQAKSPQLSGIVTATASGEGTLDDPQLNASIQIPQLQLRQNSISEVKLELHVAQHYADMDLDSKVAQVPVHAHGRVALSGDYETDAAIDTGTVPLDALMAAYSPGSAADFKGQTELHATLKGPLKETSKIEAHLSIPVLQASYQSLQIGIRNPIRADYSNSIVTLEPGDIEGTDTSLHVQGTVPVGGDSSATISAKGVVDLRILKILAPDLESSGTVALDARASGSAGKPSIQGTVQLKNVSMISDAAPVGLEKLNGTLDISEDRVQVSSMTGQVGGGQVSLGGSITYRPSVQFNLALQGQAVRLRYPDGLRSLLDANLAFSGTPEASTLNGRVLIDSLSFTPDFDVAKFADQFSTGATISQPGFADTIKLAIGVQSQENLAATSSQVSVEGQAALRVGGTAANPVITGRTTLTSGELFYRNVRYQLQNGVITFDNPIETHPVLNLSVTTTVEQYNLTLTMRGPLDKLTTSYVSDPPLATADIINLVARGQTTQEAAASSTSTDSMIASQAASELSGSVQKLAGISSLQIDPSLGSNTQNPSARVAIQQRVTKNLLFTFSTDVSQPGSEIVQGEYQINKRWSVNASRDQLGGVSVDGRFHTKF